MPKQSLVDSVQFQQASCGNLNSPFYSELFACALADTGPGTPFWEVLDAWTGNPVTARLPLRILGAVHDLVLAGRAEALAAEYPRPGVPGDAKAAWPLVNELITREWNFVASRLNDQVQTNEIRRCSALLPGFLEIARRAERPLRLAELGASAGLNLCWDAYRYRLGTYEWGNEASAIALEIDWTGDAPPSARIEIANRKGCDISPLDMRIDDDRRRLRSFVWPDHPERMERLSAAIDAAANERLNIVKMSAGDFVDQVLSERRDGEATVIYHSIMWAYVPKAERDAITLAITRASESATADSPLAWLRMEAVAVNAAALWLDYWPDPSGAEGHIRERLAHCHFHGTSVDWFGPGTT